VDEVIRLIGDHPEIEKLRRCYVEWNARGYNSSSIKWLDWYVTGIQGFSKNNKSDKNDEFLKRAMEDALREEGKIE
jgi:hypothetical protein